MTMSCPLRGGSETSTSEAVTCGHPDKTSDMISDAVLDAALALDPNSRVAVEIAGKHSIWCLGEMTTGPELDEEEIKRIAMGVFVNDVGFRADEVTEVRVDIMRQSPDIALINDPEKQGAGDQGLMYGYACWNPDYEHMPTSHALALALCNKFTEVQKAGTLPWLRPDGKSQVVVNNGEVTHVTIAAQHYDVLTQEELHHAVHEHIIKPVIGDDFPFEKCTINGTGKFVLGGYAADAGLTGRKIVVDAYGGGIPVGGGAYSGKDPTKVDRTAAYMARYIAKTIVARKMAEMAMIGLSYTINGLEPDSVEVHVHNPADPDFDFEAWVRENFPLNPGGMIALFGMTKPQGWSYKETASGGHYGRPQFPWEQVTLE